MKFALIDVETTGVSPYRDQIWQVAGLLINGSLIEEFDIRACPDDLDGIKLPEVCTVSREEMQGYQSQIRAFNEFKQVLSRFVDPFNKRDKLWLVAYNANFDSNAIRAWFRRSGDRFYGSWFWVPPIDLMALAGMKLLERRPTMKNFKLETVCRELGIKVDVTKLHDASYDTELEYELAQILIPELSE